MAKARARGEGGAGDAARGSAVAALRLGLSVLLRLFAPVLPYITDEVWAWVYAEETGQRSIHRAKWPAAGDFAEVAAPADAGLLELAAAAMAAVSKRKSELGASVGRVVPELAPGASAAALARNSSEATRRLRLKPSVVRTAGQGADPAAAWICAVVIRTCQAAIRTCQAAIRTCQAAIRTCQAAARTRRCPPGHVRRLSGHAGRPSGHASLSSGHARARQDMPRRVPCGSTGPAAGVGAGRHAEGVPGQLLNDERAQARITTTSP
ncbi:class I tRNA ligase family protein [Sorangium sp. KYC3313]|uniref:class I tRNA ligase family protein n=1 Tax=Sorangium sp. KYC3313 TaxID=3449740 RepID=UPI003F8C30C4